MSVHYVGSKLGIYTFKNTRSADTPSGGGGVLCDFYTYLGLGHFWGSIFLISIFFEFSDKK